MDKKERVSSLALSYYSRKDVRDAIFKFSKNREISPNYMMKGFGKRPDIFQYPNDILSLVRRGATSFHCSEEIWSDPLQISTDMDKEQLNELRTGWDLIIDIDCQWVDYSKKAALAIIKTLENKGVKNIGIKFSGSKGFHIIIPWSSFPKQIGENKTSDMFPEWPRAIVTYLKKLSRLILQDMIKDMKDDFSQIKGFTGVKCETCSNLAIENFQITLRCDNHMPPYIETFTSYNKFYKLKKCPICSKNLIEVKKQKFFICNHCDLNSIENPSNFNVAVRTPDIFKLLGLDILLVSSRHLFRMPYSLHEKTALASVVIDKDEIEKFSLKDADPLNVKIKNFYPKPAENEAQNLLIEAIDFYKTLEREQESKKTIYKERYGKDYKAADKEFEAIPTNLIKEEYYPPVIQKILKGMHDGRKRALFILINFFRSLNYSLEDIEKILDDWNKKNKPPIKKGYIQSQMLWHSKNKIVLPPNFDNEIYKAIGVYEMDHLSDQLKNPVNYVICMARRELRKNKKYYKKSK